MLQRIRHSDPSKQKKPILALNDPELQKMKQVITTHEQIVLRALAFNLTVIVPYSYVGPILKTLNFGGSEQEDIRRAIQFRKILKCTCDLLDDSLRTDLYTTYKSHEIAVGCIHLASRMLNISLPYYPEKTTDNSSNNINELVEWYKLFHVSLETLRAISDAMMEMYSDYKQFQGNVNL
jgi:hypothetical protein